MDVTIHSPTPRTCSNLFNLDLTVLHPPPTGYVQRFASCWNAFIPCSTRSPNFLPQHLLIGTFPVCCCHSSSWTTVSTVTIVTPYDVVRYAPFISPLLLTMTPALSSKYIKTPSFRRIGFLCLIITAGITAKQNIAIKALFTRNVFHTVKNSLNSYTADYTWY